MATFSFPDFHLCSLSSLFENRKIGTCKMPAYVLLLSLFAAIGGFMFGYDIGISGGVTVMDDFLCEFFPGVLLEKMAKQGIDIKNCSRISAKEWNEASAKQSQSEPNGGGKLYYCIFGDQKVELFTSSLYLAAMVSTFFAAYVSRQRGRKLTITLAGLFYVIGVILNIASGTFPSRHHSSAFGVLILGRILLGFGVGFGNQAIPLFLSEIAPANARGAFNHLFQLMVTIGIMFANIVNWIAHKLHPWGWRLSLGLAVIPALLLTLGSFFLVETPSSLVQRGLSSEAHKVLRLIRGPTVDANLALQSIISACNGNLHTNNQTHNVHIDDSMQGKAPDMQSSKKWFNGLFSQSNRPPLVIAIFVQLFQQFTGINLVNFYAPVILKSLGSDTELSLRFAVIIASFKVAFTLLSIYLVDRVGRRRLLIVASIVMLVTQMLIGIMLHGTIHKHNIDRWRVKVVVALVCVFVSAFACSWGPLGWLISTELFPLMCRSEGQSVSVFFNMLFTFIIAHTSLSMLCTLKLGIFFFFAIWAAIMGSFSFLFLPETMNVETDKINYLWSYHMFWRHVVSPSHSGSPLPPQSRVLALAPSFNSPSPPSPSSLEMRTST